MSPTWPSALQPDRKEIAQIIKVAAMSITFMAVLTCRRCKNRLAGERVSPDAGAPDPGAFYRTAPMFERVSWTSALHPTRLAPTTAVMTKASSIRTITISLP